MLLKIVEYAFIFVCLLLASALIMNKIYFVNIKNNLKKSDYIAGIAILIAVYFLSAILVCIFIPNVYSKVGMVLFAFSPFIIGKLATYEKEKMFTVIQIICVIASSFFVLLLG